MIDGHKCKPYQMYKVLYILKAEVDGPLNRNHTLFILRIFLVHISRYKSILGFSGGFHCRIHIFSLRERERARMRCLPHCFHKTYSHPNIHWNSRSISNRKEYKICHQQREAKNISASICRRLNISNSANFINFS